MRDLSSLIGARFLVDRATRRTTLGFELATPSLGELSEKDERLARIEFRTTAL